MRLHRRFAVSLLALVLSSGTLPALSGGDRRPTPGDRRRAQLAIMSAALAPYAEGTWEAIARRLEDDPGAAFDARLVMVAISLANGDLARLELAAPEGGDFRTRALERLEDVVLRQEAWKARAGSGGAAVYLALTVRRLAGDCGFGDDPGRVEALLQASDELLRSEASLRRTDGVSFGGFPEEVADSAAVFSAAAVLLPPSDDTEGWERAGRNLGRRVLAGCPSPEALLFGSEAALSYLIAGRGVPKELTRVPALFPGAGRSCRTADWSASDALSAEARSLDDETKGALAASRTVAVLLLEHFLWTFPPGTGCPDGAGPTD